MSEQLPDGLQLACDMANHVWHIGECKPQKRDAAIDAIRAEHAQRVTLQRHACDLAQRVADLEAERVKDAEAIATYRGQMRSLQGYAERLEDELDALHPKHDKLEAENQRLEAERTNTAEHVASIARQLGDAALQVDDIAVRVLRLVAERDELRASLAESMQISRDTQDRLTEAQKERDALRAKLAAIEAQEPVAHYRASDAEWLAMGRCTTVYKDQAEDWKVPLYASPVTAQAVPDGWRLVPLRLVTAEMVRAGEAAWYAKERDMCHPTPTEFPEGGPAEACFFAMVSAAPEHKV